MLPPPSKERVVKMYEVENSNFPFKNKSYVDALLQKWRVEERNTERVISDSESDTQKYVRT